MKRRNALIASAAGLAAILGLGHAYGSAEHGWWDHGRHGRWHDHARAHFADSCAGDRFAGFDDAMTMAREALAIAPHQEAAWQGLEMAMREASVQLAATCRSSATETSAPDWLTQAEAMVAGGLDALRAVRPAFDALYGVLDDGQRRTLDRMLADRHPA
jgi:hypothetical protein